MSMKDKVKHTAEELEGKAKQAVGGATGDRETQAEGIKDEKMGQMKGVGDKLKDVAK
ncbi:MAG: CsbD family protein [Mycobacteriales bacterium]